MKNKIRCLLPALLAVCILAGCGRNIPEEGLELLKNGDYEKAAETFQEAVEEEQNIGEAYRGIGIAKWELKEYSESKEAFLMALENGAEKTGTIYNFLGNCEMILDNPSGALNYYRLGIASEDCKEELLKELKFNEIAAYEETGDIESAKTLLAEYTKAYPDDERAAKEAEFLETR